MNFLKQNWFKVLLLSALIFIGIGLWVNANQTNDTSLSVSEVSFEKREKCANYRNKAQQQLEETYKIATSYFYDIFYSPKIDSCVYTYGLRLLGQPPNEQGSFVIADYFSGDTLFSVKYDNSSDNEKDWSSKRRPLFSEKVEEYRGK